MSQPPVQQMRRRQRNGPRRAEQAVGGFGIGSGEPSLMRREAERQQSQPRRREQERRPLAMTAPAVGHRDQRGGQGEQQDRGVQPLGQAEPAAKRGCDQQRERQRKAMDEADRRQRDTGEVRGPGARRGEAHGVSFAGGVCDAR